jgi:crotonobetainyl-CoA:carnitine CoA-transferase CaiB-like acyl-CoA transferase
MSETGHGDAYLDSLYFTQLVYCMIASAILERVVPPIEHFIASLTKDELFKGAVERRILLFPVATPKDIVENPQLDARHYFQDVTHPDLGTPVTFLGPAVGASETPVTYRRFPPKLGEHNAEIYGEELGLRLDELARLREANTI